MMREVMLYEINIGDSAVVKAGLDTAPTVTSVATNVQPKRKKAKVQNQTDVPVDIDQPDDHEIDGQPKVRGSRKAPQKLVAVHLVVSNAEFSWFWNL